MAYRFTNTEKWSDSWFASLSPVEKLLFIYLCDNCDMAGFIEINLKLWSVHTDIPIKQIEGALEGLKRGFIISNSNDCFFIRNFLKHQKNLPLNPENKAHAGILRRFQLYSYKFDIQDINQFIQRGLEGASKGLSSPTGNGIGNGVGILKGGVGGKLDYRQTILNLFCEKYKNEFDREYVVVSNGKEMAAIGWLLKTFKQQNKDADTKKMTELFSDFFTDVMGIQDKWIRNNLTPSIIMSKYNEIKAIIDSESANPNLRYQSKTKNTDYGADDNIAAVRAELYKQGGGGGY